MALPEGITPKTVSVGIPTKFNGTPATGSATLTAPKNLVHVPTGTPLFSGSVTKQFKGLTEVTFTDLTPTDADGLNRVDWTYTLTVRVNGAAEQPEPIVFVIPEAGPDTIDADLLVEVPSSAGTPVYALVASLAGPNTWTGAQDFTGATVTGISVTPADASATVKGIVELATTAEATTGTDTVRAVTPAGLKAVADTKISTTAADLAYLPTSPLWVSDYDGPDVDGTAVPPWTVKQVPSVSSVLQPGRISLVSDSSVPGTGTDTRKPSGSVMRVELRPYSATNPGTLSPADGDVTDLSGSLTNRSEVYGRSPEFMSGTPAAQWPDPVGSIRWYGVSVYVPSSFVAATDTKWLTFAQWKGYHGGSPPISLEIKRGNFRLGGTRTGSGLIPNDGTLAALTLGSWARFVVGMKLSTDPAVGWVEVWLNDVQVLARTSVATMDTFGGTGDANADPIYLKQGIYRDSAWAATHTFHFGPTKVGTTRAAVNAADVDETSVVAAARVAAVGSGVTLETTGVPLGGGVAAPGVAATAAASDHVHPRREFGPQDYGWISWAFDPVLAQAASTPTNGRLELVRVHVPVATTITNIILNVSGAGTSMTAGQNFAALYDSSRALLAITADQSTAWATAGPQVMPLASPQAVAAGDYYVGFWSRSTGTSPSFSRGLSNLLVNLGLSATNMRFGTSSTALTTTAPNPAASPSAGAVSWWVAIS